MKKADYMGRECVNAYKALANAIVLEVVKDYRSAVETINDPHASDRRFASAKRKIAECEKWFLSDYGQMLSRNMGEVIIEGLRKEIIVPLEME